jgi:MYXO-CTERM domain-containing protein
MSFGRSRAALLTFAVAFAFISASVGRVRSASAQEECPLGSTEKTESGSTWCEPTVCATDTNCATGSICRPVPLCVEIGAIDPKAPTADGGQRLLVRQRCGADKSCPQKTTCSEQGRCITRAQADKAGLLTPSTAASGGAASGGAPTEPAKKSCGCHVPGGTGGELPGGALALALTTLVLARRRRRGPQ